MFEPARLGCFGVRLQTAVSLVVAVDLFRALLSISSMVSGFVAKGEVAAFTLAYGLLLLGGGVLGGLGLAKKNGSLLRWYGWMMVIRILVSFGVVLVFLTHIHEQVTDMVDTFIEQATKEAQEHHQDIPPFDRDAMIEGGVKAITFFTVIGETLGTVVTLYCVHLVRSLAHWMQPGAPTSQGEFPVQQEVGAPPVLYRYVAQPREPLLLRTPQE
jgi:hypothetical protein